MKSIKLAVAVLTVLVMLPASAFALVDIGVYGGYSIGSLESKDESMDMNGWEYGFFGHYNTGVPMLFSIGIGGFYQRTSATLDTGSNDLDVTRSAYGLDLMATLELPIIIHPFIRGGIAVSETFEVDGDSSSEKFKYRYFGIGAGITVFPMVRIFGEYIYSTSKIESGDKINGNAFRLGAMLNI